MRSTSLKIKIIKIKRKNTQNLKENKNGKIIKILNFSR
jgi:hypothetical protein